MADETKIDPNVPPSKRGASRKSGGPNDTRPGGCYIQGGTPDPDFPGKHWGGRLVDAHGNVLATFADDQVNTGVPEDGSLIGPDGNPLPKKEPEPVKEPVKAEVAKPEPPKK